MKRIISLLLTSLMLVSLFSGCSAPTTKPEDDTNTVSTELEGEITFWHSFTQGPRMENIQAAADAFMADHPKVKINIETYSWGDFYTKWTTGLASGNVPDMSTARSGEVIEMINAGAILPLDDLIDRLVVLDSMSHQFKNLLILMEKLMQFLFIPMHMLCGIVKTY